jgi:hypothetical protein
MALAKRRIVIEQSRKTSIEIRSRQLCPKWISGNEVVLRHLPCLTTREVAATSIADKSILTI